MFNPFFEAIADGVFEQMEAEANVYELLEEPFAFEANKDDASGWYDSVMRSWLNSKVFAGLSPDWQQVLHLNF